MCCSMVMYSRSYRQYSLNWVCVPSLLPTTGKNGKVSNLNFLKINTTENVTALGICLSVDKHIFDCNTLFLWTSHYKLDLPIHLWGPNTLWPREKNGQQVMNKLLHLLPECDFPEEKQRLHSFWSWPPVYEGAVVCFAKEYAAWGKEVIHCYKRVRLL